MTENHNTSTTSNDRERDRVWKSLKINDNDYMIYFTKENESWNIFLTNLIEIWTESLTDKIIFHRCQTMNRLLNLEAFYWKQEILDILNDIPRYIKTNVLEDNKCRIELQKVKDFVKFKFSLDLVKGTPQLFWENITMPLCSSSIELIRRNKLLLDLVKQKDEEIAEYKAEGAKLIRNYIATKPFSEELFHANAAELTTDFIKSFSSVFHFYNEINMLKLRAKIESEMISNSTSDINDLKIDGNVLSDLSKNKSEQELKQHKLNDEHLEIEKCGVSSSSSKTPILRISSTSHTIYKLKKNRKTLNDLIM